MLRVNNYQTTIRPESTDERLFLPVFQFLMGEKISGELLNQREKNRALQGTWLKREEFFCSDVFTEIENETEISGGENEFECLIQLALLNEFQHVRLFDIVARQRSDIRRRPKQCLQVALLFS